MSVESVASDWLVGTLRPTENSICRELRSKYWNKVSYKNIAKFETQKLDIFLSLCSNLDQELNSTCKKLTSPHHNSDVLISWFKVLQVFPQFNAIKSKNKMISVWGGVGGCCVHAAWLRVVPYLVRAWKENERPFRDCYMPRNLKKVLKINGYCSLLENIIEVESLDNWNTGNLELEAQNESGDFSKNFICINKGGRFLV